MNEKNLIDQTPSKNDKTFVDSAHRTAYTLLGICLLVVVGSFIFVFWTAVSDAEPGKKPSVPQTCYVKEGECSQ